jgi:hypothetical protein
MRNARSTRFTAEAQRRREEREFLRNSKSKPESAERAEVIGSTLAKRWKIVIHRRDAETQRGKRVSEKFKVKTGERRGSRGNRFHLLRWGCAC